MNGVIIVGLLVYYVAYITIVYLVTMTQDKKDKIR